MGVLRFPLHDLPRGEIAPPLEPGHPTWRIIAPWTDPLADRGAYRVTSEKERVEDEYGPAVRLRESHLGGRALVAEGAEMRDATVVCRMRPMQVGIQPSNDGFQFSARAGLLFRMETIRRHYFFCVEDCDRIVLYRRIDDDWHVLDWLRVELPESPLTLRAELDGDSMRVACPELDVAMTAVDRALPRGKAGFRSMGEALLYDLRVETTAAQDAENRKFSQQRKSVTRSLGKDLPDAVPAGEWCLSRGRPVLCDAFVTTGRNDLLWSTPGGLEARTWEGETLWHSSVRPSTYQAGRSLVDGGRRLYLLAGEQRREERLTVAGRSTIGVVADEIVILDGATGEEVARAPLPEDIPRSRGQLVKWDFSFETGFGRCDGDPDFLVRQWHSRFGGGGVNVWVYDRDANLLWTRETETLYGHHNAVHWADVNRDGRPEVLAGGTCLSAEGDLVWIHDKSDEMRRIKGAGHYDAVLAQPAENWPHADPIAFLLGGSAGVYVVDARTGETRAVHRVGHAQWGMWCDVRTDLPGQECMVGTRWGNYGILTLFSAVGEKLWSVQPDYVLQDSCPVRWSASAPQLLWINTSERAMGLYDGHGRLVHPLPELRKVFAGKTRMQVPAAAWLRRPGGRHWLGLEWGETLYLFRPEDDI